MNQTWIVSDASCPESDFTTIQEAVDAASDGDTILVRLAPNFIDRSYEIVQKSLTIVRGSNNFLFNLSAVGGDATIRDLLPNQSVTIIGIGHFAMGKLVLKDNQGSVWIESASFGRNPTTNVPPYYEAVRVENCTSVTFMNCGWTAPDYMAACLPGDPCLTIPGSVGAVLINSEAHVFKTSIRGGEGGPGYDPFNLGTAGGKGGAGVRLENSTLYAYGSSLNGGQGGSNSQNLPAPFCADGGPGGASIVLADTSSQAILQDTTLSPGIGGKWTTGTPVPLGCSDGPTGVPLEGPGAGNVSFLAGTTRSVFITELDALVEGETANLQMSGEFGDIIFLGVGLDPDPVFQAPFSGTSVFTPLEIIRLGKINMSGVKTIPIVPGDIVGPGESITVYLQTYNFDTSLNLHYSAPSARVVLDSSHDPADGCPTTFYVDDDAPGDPGPNDSFVSDPLEDGTLLRPYDSIQEAITLSPSALPITVRVADGSYDTPLGDGIQMGGRRVLIQSENGPDNCVVDAAGADHVFKFTTTTATPEDGLQGVTVTGATDGGVRIDNSDVTIDGCIIEGNSGVFGGGIRTLKSSARISSCIVRNNMASNRGGGIHALQSQLSILNSEIVENTAPSGAGVHFDSNPANDATTPLGVLRGCTVANNNGVGVYYRTSVVFTGTNEAENLLAWGNIGGVQVQVRRGTLVLDYADVQGGAGGVLLEGAAVLAPGPGFIDMDPLFVDPVLSDYHLSAGSPCIDAGDPAFVSAPGELDIDGEARVKGTGVDLGSDEF